MLKVPLNTKQANKLCQRNGCTCFNAHWLLSIKIYNHGTVKTAHGTVTPSLSTKNGMPLFPENSVILYTSCKGALETY